MNALHLVILALAVSRLTRLVVSDSITEGLRVWLWRRWPASDSVFGDSEVVAAGPRITSGSSGFLETKVEVFRQADGWYAMHPRFVGNLISCAWCTGIWVGIMVWAAWWFYPDAVYWLAPLALAEVAGLLNDR